MRTICRSVRHVARRADLDDVAAAQLEPASPRTSASASRAVRPPGTLGTMRSRGWATWTEPRMLPHGGGRRRATAHQPAAMAADPYKGTHVHNRQLIHAIEHRPHQTRKLAQGGLRPQLGGELRDDRSTCRQWPSRL